LIITTDEQLDKLKAIGRICAMAREAMAAALRPGMTTQELDEIGAKFLAEHGAESAPVLTYEFPGATCISVNEEIAHGIPGNRVLHEGDLINIDVSAMKDGVFADCGASYILGKGDLRLEKLCREGKKAMWAGYTLIRNLASHGVGDSLHDEPGEVPTWPDRSERRKIQNGLVFTIEPFLSLGGQMAEQLYEDDEWTLTAEPLAPTVQYEHTIVATPRGAVVVTLAG
jgi:methionyl aminopeptidase